MLYSVKQSKGVSCPDRKGLIDKTCVSQKAVASARAAWTVCQASPVCPEEQGSQVWSQNGCLKCPFIMACQLILFLLYFKQPRLQLKNSCVCFLAITFVIQLIFFIFISAHRKVLCVNSEPKVLHKLLVEI